MSGSTGPEDAEAPSSSDAARPSRLRQIASIVTTAVFMGLVALVVYQRRRELADMFDEPGWPLVAIGVLVVAGHFVNSAEFLLLYRAQGLRLGIWENWTLFLATQFGNLLPGQAGSLYRFRYLKVIHKFDYGRSGANFGANLAITMASSALSAFVGLTMVLVGGGSVSPILIVVVVLVGVGSGTLLLIELPDLPFLPSVAARAWRQFRLGWEMIRQQRRVARNVMLLDVVKYILVAWRFQVAFGLLGIDPGFGYFLVIAPAAGVAGTIAFTPAGFGVREGLITAAAVGMGTAVDTGLLAATVDRGVMLLTALTLGTLGFLLTRRRMMVGVLHRDVRSDGAPDPRALESQPGT